jgi:hypothetical protein
MSKKPRTESESTIESESTEENIHQEIRNNSIQFEGATYNSIEVGMNAGFGELNDKNTDQESIHSFGFRTCLAVIIITKDTKRILLQHCSPNSFQEEDVFVEEIREKVNSLAEKADIHLGFSSKGLQVALKESMQDFLKRENPISREEQECFINESKNEAFNLIEHLKITLIASKVIDLPNDSILIKRNGEIIIGIPDEEFRKPATQTLPKQTTALSHNHTKDMGKA